MSGFLLAKVYDPWTIFLTGLSNNDLNDYNVEGHFWTDKGQRYCQLFDKILGRPVVWCSNAISLDELLASPFIKEIRLIDSETVLPFRVKDLRESLTELIEAYLQHRSVYLIEMVDITLLSRPENIFYPVANHNEYIKRSKQLLFSLHDESYILFSIIWNMYLSNKNFGGLVQMFHHFHDLIGEPQQLDFTDETPSNLNLMLSFCSRLGDGYRSVSNNILQLLSRKEN